MVPVIWGSGLIAAPANRMIATLHNGVEVPRFGGFQTRPPVVLVPPMMLSANVFDITSNQGTVGVLHDLGADPWVVDFDSPGQFRFDHQDADR